MKDKSVKEEYIEFIYSIQKIKGLDDLSAKLIGNLYIATEELSLEELSKKTGYSLSAVSTSLKSMRKMGFVNKMRKPGSKRAYFYMEKDIVSKFRDILKERYKKIFSISKKKLPKIIEKYESDKSKTSKHELLIVKNNYKQLLALEKVMSEFLKKWEEASRKIEVSNEKTNN